MTINKKSLYICEPRGFCMGVTKALKVVDDLLRESTAPLYIYQDIVHNHHIVNRLKEQGVIFIYRPEDIPPRQRIVISAHGVSPSIKEVANRQHCQIIDVTCPIVQRVHHQVHKFTKEGRHVLYIGHSGHEEVRGVVGEVPDKITLVTPGEKLPKIPDHLSYGVLSQTTLNAEDIDDLVGQLKGTLSSKVDTTSANVCYATTERQAIVRQLSSKVDLFYIIGSKNSSNARRLQEIAAEKTESYLINDTDQIDSAIMYPAQSIGISSAASTPETIVKKVINEIKARVPVQNEIIVNKETIKEVFYET